MAAATQGYAVLLGDRDLGAPLAAAGLSVTAVCHPAAASRFSRYYQDWLPDPGPDQESLLTTLVEHARRMPEPVGLYYQRDDDLLLISRHRQRLAEDLLFTIAQPDLVEQLVDKAAFHQLAQELDLPVPRTQIVDPATEPPQPRDVAVPAVVKPLRREETWGAAFRGKALLVETAQELHDLMAALGPGHARVLVQQPIPGPESRIESYHVYVDPAGDVAAEFTGRKVRTHPQAFGHSTAVVTTDSEDVARLGRHLVRRLGLTGVAKFDFKRDSEGRLWLLEVNPRFNLWHHVGAAAGVNIPAAVWADLRGLPRRPRAEARPGVRWCWVERDWRAARESGIGVLPWLRWVAACETRAGLDPTDPLPVVAKAAEVARGRLPGGSRRPAERERADH